MDRWLKIIAGLQAANLACMAVLVWQMFDHGEQLRDIGALEYAINDVGEAIEQLDRY